MHLRRSELCSDSVTYCEKATEVKCEGCGNTWAPPDIGAPGNCPACGSRCFLKFHQNDCEICRLDAAMDSDAGRRINRAVELLNALEAGFSVTTGDVTDEAFHDVLRLREERDKYIAEKAPNGSH